MKLSLALLGILLLTTAQPLSAHGGKTDASGCHTEKATGEYHCHSGSKQAKTEAKTEAKIEAKNAAKGTGMICSFNAYNCADFSSHDEAQGTYESCVMETGKDVHDLDRDKDGVACEDL